MTNFRMKKIDVSVPKNKKSRGFTILKLSALFFLLIWSGYGILSFITAYDFRSPIILQTPIIKKRNATVSPVSKKKHSLLPFVQKVYASEPITPKLAVKVATIKEFGIEHWDAMEQVITPESGFNPYAINPTSGACGLFQANPCSKLGCKLEDIECQVDWGIGYIKARYGTPTNALAFRLVHNWY